MNRLTVIVVPDEATSVRRFQVPGRLVTYGPWVAAVIAILLLAGGIDYVRLRLDAVDVGRLRQQTANHRDELDGLAGELTSLQEEFGRLLEFERKVRVIADLPGAMLEAELPDGGTAGLGGGMEEPASSTPAAEAETSAEGDASTKGGRGGPEHLEPPLPRSASLDLDGEVLARTRAGIRRLTIRASTESTSFEELIEDLEGKRHRLASTPSIWPTEGWVTSGYGYRISPFTGRRSFHSGLDIASDFGTPIVAPARGRVVFSGRKGPRGKTVMIDHGFGLRTSYGHAAEIHVKRGEEVERGQRIASVGSTGRSTGPHVHYSVEVKGKSVNPRNYIFE
jgi:murein DD-endopeptidase MepM/ murein hydrolase activator NlpD